MTMGRPTRNEIQEIRENLMHIYKCLEDKEFIALKFKDILRDIQNLNIKIAEIVYREGDYFDRKQR